MSFGTGYEGSHLGLDDYKGDKGEGEEVDISGSVGAEVLNEGSAYAQAAAEEYGMKAKTVEHSAKWFRNLVNEKEMILSQVKKRAKLLRALAAESLQNAEQHRKSAAEKLQASKALETKARELESLAKEQSIQAGDLKTKADNEMKQYLEALINRDVAETNAETNLAEAERQRTWGGFLERKAEEMNAEAFKWERTSAETLGKAKKLKTDAAAETAKAKEFEKKRKEAEDAASDAEKKANEFCYFELEFFLKAQAEELQAVLAKIKAKYLQLLYASISENASYMDMFANMQDKDGNLWEKKTASLRAEAKLLEESAKKMYQASEKLKASLKKEAPKANEKKEELVIQDTRAVKPEPALQPKIEAKPVEVPKAVVPEKKM